MNSDRDFYELRESISKDVKIIKEMNSLFSDFNSKDNEEKNMIFSQINLLKNSLRKENENISKKIKSMYLAKPLTPIMNRVEDFDSEIKPKNKNLKGDREIDFKPNFFYIHFIFRSYIFLNLTKSKIYYSLDPPSILY